MYSSKSRGRETGQRKAQYEGRCEHCQIREPHNGAVAQRPADTMADRPGPVSAAGGGNYPWWAWSGLLAVTPCAGDEPDGLGPANARGREPAAARQSCHRAPGDERSCGSVRTPITATFSPLTGDTCQRMELGGSSSPS